MDILKKIVLLLLFVCFDQQLCSMNEKSPYRNDYMREKIERRRKKIEDRRKKLEERKEIEKRRNAAQENPNRCQKFVKFFEKLFNHSDSIDMKGINICFQKILADPTELLFARGALIEYFEKKFNISELKKDRETGNNMFHNAAEVGCEYIFKFFLSSTISEFSSVLKDILEMTNLKENTPIDVLTLCEYDDLIENVIAKFPQYCPDWMK